MNEEQKSCIGAECDFRLFAEWVADEIFDDYWEYNKDAFAEIACRKLCKLGLVEGIETVDGGEWERIR